jgi:sulfur carrier protein ThiS
MTATLRPSGALRELVNGQTDIQVQTGISIKKALTGLGIKPELVALVVVNEVQQSKDYLIQDGDLIRVLAVIGGG